MVRRVQGGGAGSWLSVLREVAIWLPQPAAITTAGELRRAPGQGRIAFLAQVRNAALAPLWTVSRVGQLLGNQSCSFHFSAPRISIQGIRALLRRSVY